MKLIECLTRILGLQLLVEGPGEAVVAQQAKLADSRTEDKTVQLPGGDVR